MSDMARFGEMRMARKLVRAPRLVRDPGMTHGASDDFCTS